MPILSAIRAFYAASQQNAAMQHNAGHDMVRTTTVMAALAAALTSAGPVLAQGFSAGGAAGVAAMQGATASPGYSGASDERAADGAVASLWRRPADARRPIAPTDIDLPPIGGGLGVAFPLR